MKILLLIILSININATQGPLNYVVRVPTSAQASFFKSLENEDISFKIFYEKAEGYFKDLYFLKFNKIKTVEKLEKKYQNLLFQPILKSVRPMALVPNNTTPIFNDNFSNFQWYINNSDHKIIRDIDDIRSETINGKKGQDLDLISLYKKIEEKNMQDIVVAVIDSGVAIDHPELKDNIAINEIECDEGRIPFNPKNDNDNNGFKGDCKGWDFTGDESNRPFDESGHGTHIAGIISAKGKNNKGIHGIANNIKILPIKVMGSDSRPTAFTDKIAKAILYSIDRKVDIINMSLGWPSGMDTEFLREAFKLAKEKGIIIIAAAGNNTSRRPILPCAYQSVICVGATSVDGSMAPFSNRGPHVDLLAPGEDIISTYPESLTPTFFSSNGYELISGTSQAAPMISAVFGILKGLFPSLKQDQLLARIGATTLSRKEIGDSLGGLVQAGKAYTADNPVYFTPMIKNNDTIIINNDHSFKSQISFKNYGNQISDVKIKITFQEKILENDTFHFQDINQSQIVNINLSGSINNLDSESKKKYHIKIFIKNELYKEFSSDAHFVMDINKHKEIKLENSKNLMVKMKGKLVSRIKSVPTMLKASKNGLLYSWMPSKESIILNIFKKINDNYKSFTKVFDDTSQISSIHHIDLNNDQIDDILLRTIDKERESVIFYYLDDQLNPLFPKYKFKYIPRYTILNTQDFRIIPFQTSQGVMGIPLYLAKGTIPEKDRNPDPWVSENLDELIHLYFLMPNLSTGEIDNRIIDNFKFVENITEQLKLDWSATIDLHFFLNTKKTKILMSTGEFFNRSGHILEIGNNLNLTFKPYNFPLLTTERPRRIDVIGNRDLFALSDLQSSHQLSYQYFDTLNIDTTTNSIIKELNNDSILGSFSSFLKEDQLYTVFQTKTKINVLSSDQLSSYPLERVSFLNDQTFNQAFIPLNIKRPAFYVDTTQLNSKHSFILKINPDGEWIAPISTSFYAGDNCKSISPDNIEGNLTIRFLCLKSKEAYLKFIPVH